MLMYYILLLLVMLIDFIIRYTLLFMHNFMLHYL